jgi:glycosyltransferase involved in cell wall biosynthesis
VDRLTIAISTYNTPEYLEECLDSLLPFDCRILVAIDGCNDALKMVKSRQWDKNIEFYYNPINQGTFINRNSLAMMVKTEWVLFFDSDDIFANGQHGKLLNAIQNPNYKVVRFNIHNFTGNTMTNIMRGEGVFCIELNTFKKLGGFENWVCSADTEFRYRHEALGYKSLDINSILMLRRHHDKNLTIAEKTRLKSPLRESIWLEYNNRAVKNVPIKMVTTDLQFLT